MNLVCDNFEKLFISNKENYVLGSWCLNDRLKKKYNVTINTKEKESYSEIYKNFLLSEKLEKEILTIVSKELNMIHNVNFSRRYWEILLSPWLRKAINILLFRYNNIKKIEKKITSIVRLYDENSCLSCNNTLEAVYLQYNMEKSNNLDIEILNYLSTEHTLIKKKYQSKFLNLPKLKFSSVKNLNLNNNVPVICETNLSIFDKCLLYFKLGFIPRNWHFPKDVKIKTDISLRKILTNKFSENSNNNKKFQYFFRQIFYKIIPTCFLEGYHKNRELSKNINLPTNPSFIFTMSGFTFHEIFRFYYAEIAEKKIPIISWQHGCNYGVSYFTVNKSPEEKYLDKFLTYGWKEKKNDIPMFIYQKNYPTSKAIKEKILIVLDGIPFQNHGFNIYLNNDLYKKNMAIFFDALNKKLKIKLLLKPHPKTDSRNIDNLKYWRSFKFYKKNFIRIKNDKRSIPLLKRYSRITVHTTEGTAFYQDI